MVCVCVFAGVGGGNDFQWCFSQVKGAVDEDVAEGKAHSTSFYSSMFVREKRCLFC